MADDGEVVFMASFLLSLSIGEEGSCFLLIPRSSISVCFVHTHCQAVNDNPPTVSLPGHGISSRTKDSKTSYFHTNKCFLPFPCDE